ncbi:MAG: hypothetical protein KDC93_07505 [Cyclobacteriaceae bacterium]|nr:hypothetical protein [Cyclobacteriaceae bacterium]
MKKEYVYIFMLMFFCMETKGQMLSNVEAIESGGSLSQYNMIGKKRPAPEVFGNYYLFDNWVLADIHLEAGNFVADQNINLNALDGEIEIPYGDEVRTLNRTKIESFEVENRKFINGKYLDASTFKDTFFEVIEEGAVEVYCQYYTDVRPPTYVPGLAVGDQNYKVLIKQNHFVKAHSTLKGFVNDKKANFGYFENHAATLKYIQTQKLRLNKIEDFITATKFYNSNYSE